ncbi:MAG TPA: amino acid adenylation domain-containing protein [Roseiflexaceae bacterium]|nr:amino acid adenylation domain-containing protein [Roseiflexaceae bacterium]
MSTGVFVFPMSFAQQRLWFLDQISQRNASYNISGALRLGGPLDVPALGRALAALVERHESLRTTFGFADGAPAQLIAEQQEIPLRVIPLGPDGVWERAAEAEAALPFDLHAGPLLRVALLRRDATDHVLVATMHHIVSDGWSVGVLLRELSELYAAALSGRPAPLPPPALQYADFAHWQREWLQGAALERQLAYWRRQLAAPTVLQLPTDAPRPAVQTFAGAVERFVLPAALTADLRALARREQVTLAALLLAAFQTLLHRYSGQDDILVGLPVAGRNRTDVEGIIGLFVNTLVIRADLSGNPAFGALARRVHRTALDAYAHQDIPFEKLVEELQPERSLGHTPLFQVAFNFQEAPAHTLTFPGVAVEPLDLHTGTSKFDLTLDIEDAGVELRCVIEYNTALFAPARIARMAGHFQRLLAGVCAGPATRIGALPLLSAEEQRALVGGPLPPALPAEPLHRLFEQQVSRRPSDTAVVDGERRISYAELDRRANQLAQFLQELGVGPDRLVGLHVERSLDLLVGILGILKAGGAYLPLDPAYPRERRAFMLADSGADVLLTQRHLADEDRVAETGGAGGYSPRLICLDADWEEIAQRPAAPPPLRTDPEQLAYVIYTSGSTGRPKGVAVTHANVVRLFQQTDAWFGFDGSDVWTLFHSYAFDFSVWEIWGALLYGGRLVVVPQQVARSPDACYALIADQGVTVLNQTPSAFRQLVQLEAQGLVEPRPLALRYVIFGGEALDPAALAPWFARHGDRRPLLVNMYGITETTVHVTYRPVLAEDAATTHSSPIGLPIPDLRIFLLDRYGNLVPPGVAGEIHVGGAGLARGYGGRPELTAERFVPDPFGVGGAEGWGLGAGEEHGEPRTENREPSAGDAELKTQNSKLKTQNSRLYKTGDLARSLPDGGLEYLGRIDQQVKIRGFRIELGEIEAVLARHPDVREAVVLVREDAPGNKRLVAYLVPEEPRTENQEPRSDDAELKTQNSKLRTHLQGQLPEYMVPTAFVYLDAFPLTENGKLNRAALPAPEREQVAAGADYAPPRTPAEELLAAVWAKALNLDRVGIHDNFFAIGGDSILSLHVLAAARERGAHFSLQQLFQHPTIAELARVSGAAAEQPQTAPFDLVSPADRRRLPPEVEDAYPLAMLQAGMLYHIALAPESNIYHNTDSYHLAARTSFDLPLFEQAVAAVVARHPVLRTGFDLTGYSEPLQLVYSHAVLPTELHDIRHLPHEAQERLIAELVASETKRHFDIARPSLLRFFIHLRSDTTFQFTLTECHAIIDGWSLNSTLVEIFQLYFALLRGEPPAPPAPLAVSFRDFVALERAALASPEQEQFWMRKLDGAAFLPLPRWPAAPPSDLGASPIRIHTQVLPPELYAALQRLVKTTGVPLKNILLAAHLKIMGLLGGRDDVLAGVGVNGRPETLDGAQLRGLFFNTVPLRLQLRAGSWLDLIAAAFAAEQELLPFRRYPGAALQQKWGRVPLYEVMFHYLHFHVLYGLAEAVPDLEELDTIRCEGTNIPLVVCFQAQPLTGHMTLDIDYDATQFCREQVERMAGYYLSTLAAMVADPRQPHHTFSPLSDDERQLLLGSPAPPAPRAPGCVHRQIAEQAARRPGQTAVVAGERSLTYAELERHTNRLARHLHGLGVGPGALVGVCLERSPELVVGILAVLKAGGAYVPLDPAYPPQRLEQMCADLGLAALVTRSDLAERLPASVGQPVCLDLLGDALAQHSDAPFDGGASPDDLIYVIFTSGSTGRPKGAAVFHRGFANLLDWFIGDFAIDARDRTLLLTSPSFDLTQKNFFAPLMTGGTLHLWAPGYYDPAAIARLVQQQAITLLNCTPSAFYPLIEDGQAAHLELLASLRRVFLGGEPIAAARLAPWALSEHCRAEVVNTYGPTECTDICGFYRLPPAIYTEGGPVPLGRAIPGTRMLVLGPGQELLPVGVPGELCVTGAGVGYGYIGDPALTAAKFVPEPVGAPGWGLPAGDQNREPRTENRERGADDAEPTPQNSKLKTQNSRLYKTGDLARVLPDGTVEFLGRLDHQVKLRGFRIELGEIDQALARHPRVRECVTLLREDIPGQPRLVAYIVPEEPRTENGEPDVENAELKTQNSKLKTFLAELLPDYMVPSAFVWLHALPLTPNGKVDRQALPAPARADAPAAAAQPRSELERLIAQVWCEVLQIEHVGIHDTFFELGGHSLLIVRMHALVQQRLGRELPVTDVLQYPTIQALAGYLSQGADAADERTQRRIDARREARRDVAQRSQARDRRQAARQATGDGDDRDS